MKFKFNSFGKKGNEVEAVDIDKFINQPRGGIVSVNQVSDMAESLKQLNDDSINMNTKMSAIDLRSRLDGSELTSILIIDTWVTFGALPLKCLDFTTRKKRLAVSLKGQGRKEMVELVAGKREQENAKSLSMFDKIKGIFSGEKPQTNENR